jgi:hypothetical protein
MQRSERNWYCNFTATGDPIDVERFKKGLDELWCAVEIKELMTSVSAKAA